MSCNFATHATCPLALTMYQYNELQVSSTTQKLSCKASCNTPFFFIMNFVFTTLEFSQHVLFVPFQDCKLCKISK